MLQQLAETSPEDHPSEALQALIRAPVARAVAVWDALLWLALTYLMVAKPFS